MVTANRGSAKAVYKEQKGKRQSVEMALLKKELSRFYTSSTYMLNCGLGIVLMLVAAAALLWKRDMITAFIDMGLSQDLLSPSWPFYVLMPMTLLLFVVVMDALGLCLDLKMPNLKWTNEMVPIKQSMPVMLTLFGGWVLIAVLAVAYWLLSDVLSAILYLVFVCLVLGGAAFVLLRYLRHTGAEIFENL